MTTRRHSIFTGKKNIPGFKLTAEDEIKKGTKRVPFGEITNTNGDNCEKSRLKGQLKKDVNTFEKKVKTSLRFNQSRSVSVETRRTEAEEKVFVCPEPIRTLPPEGVPDFDGETHCIQST